MDEDSNKQNLQLTFQISNDLASHHKYHSRRVFKSSKQIKVNIAPRHLIRAFWHQFKKDFLRRMDELVYLNDNNMLSDHELEVVKKYSLVMGEYLLVALKDDEVKQKTIFSCASKLFIAQENLAKEIKGLNKNNPSNPINAITTLKEMILDIRHLMFSITTTKEAIFINAKDGSPLYRHRPIRQGAKEAFLEIMRQHVAANGPMSRPREKKILRRLEDLGHKVSERTLRYWKCQAIKNNKQQF